MEPDVREDPLVADIAARLAAVRHRVAAAAVDVGRQPDEVRVLLASKTQPLAVVRAAVRAGADLLGENRVQELVAKGPGLADLRPELHLIGHLQSNKVNAAVRWSTCIQSVDSLELAQRISDRCSDQGRTMDVLVQVNVSGEDSKSGVAPPDAVPLATAVAGLAHLRLTGLMTIGALGAPDEEVRNGFRRLRGLRDAIRDSGAPGTATCQELSMGMSGDLEAAVAEGATMVRVGSAVFGERRITTDVA